MACRVREQTQKGVRRTQTLKLSQLILKYGFSLLAITKRPEEIYALLTLSKNELRKMDRNCIIDLKDFTPVTEKYAA